MESGPPVTIATTKLKSKDVPADTDVWDEGLTRFALSFNGYRVLGEDLPNFCNAVKSSYELNPEWLRTFSIKGLRLLLFYEQRRARWMDDGTVDEYTAAIIALLRKQLPR
jgi:hypothetical protein